MIVMKKMLFTLLTVFICLFGVSQQMQGKVTYERTSQMQIMINDNGQGDQPLSRTITDKFELLFGNNQSLWHMSDEETPPDEQMGGAVQIRMIGGGADDVSFYDFTTGTSKEQREVFGKKFIITDSIEKLNWKLSGETKTLLNQVCQRAAAQRIGIRMMMNMDNGKMDRKEVSDTSTIVAWFTPDIPVATGPAEYQNQLPGLILEIDLNNGKQNFKAIELLSNADIAAIKEPKSGKKLTRKEFQKESDKMMEDMQRNNPGGNRVMRFNN